MYSRRPLADTQAPNFDLRRVKLVKDWAKDHQDELMADWQLAIQLKPLQRIAGADND